MITERWRWQPSEIWELDFDEFCLFADTARELFKRDAEANKAPGR